MVSMRVTATVALFLCIISVSDGRKKKTASEGGEDAGGMFTCTDIYIGGYHNGTGDDNYVGWDHGQAEDNITMLNSNILDGICVGIPYKTEADYEVLTTVTTTTPGSNGLSVVDSGFDRRLLSAQSARRLLADYIYTTNLPDLPSSCDDDNELSTCTQAEYEWQCRMIDVEAVMARLREVQVMEGDDCWTTGSAVEFQCEGAPLGPQACAFTPLASDKYATGIKGVVEGDACTACSLNADLCPEFYDIHSCRIEWEGVSSTAPSFNTTFQVSYEINAAPRELLPSLLISTFVAILVIFSS